MRPELEQIKQIEDFLKGNMKDSSRWMFQTKTWLNPKLAKEVLWQKLFYRSIRQEGRKQLKTELEVLHQKLYPNS